MVNTSSYTEFYKYSNFLGCIFYYKAKLKFYKYISAVLATLLHKFQDILLAQGSHIVSDQI